MSSFYYSKIEPNRLLFLSESTDLNSRSLDLQDRSKRLKRDPSGNYIDRSIQRSQGLAISSTTR